MAAEVRNLEVLFVPHFSRDAHFGVLLAKAGSAAEGDAHVAATGRGDTQSYP